jgi:hypothetical protein
MHVSVQVMFVAGEFVFATGVSFQYFNHSADAVSSIQQAFPDKSILLYDLGLTQEQQHQVATSKVSQHYET